MKKLMGSGLFLASMFNMVCYGAAGSSSNSVHSPATLQKLTIKNGTNKSLRITGIKYFYSSNPNHVNGQMKNLSTTSQEVGINSTIEIPIDNLHIPLLHSEKRIPLYCGIVFEVENNEFPKNKLLKISSPNEALEVIKIPGRNHAFDIIELGAH